MEQARPDSTLLPAAQIEADRGRDERITQLLTGRPTAVLPEPGSEEAKAAWRAACHEHSIRSLPLHDCAELDHPTGGAWTTRGLLRAMEAGEITVVEYVRLQPIASERELRLAEIAHDLRIGELFALAHADEYPVASDENAAATTVPDPIFAAIEAHRTAWAACEGLDDGKDPDGYEAAHDACTEALEAVEHTQPTTTAGLLALARYLDELLNREAGGQNVVSPTSEGHALAALINACLGLADGGTAGASDAPTKPDPILAAIAASQSAEAAMTAFAEAVAGRRMTDAERTQEDAIERDQRDTRAAVWATVPSTPEGRAALARYVVSQAELTFGADWRAKVQEEFCGDMLLALLAAIEAETAADIGPDGAIVELAAKFCRAYALNAVVDRAMMAGTATEEQWKPHHDATMALTRQLAATTPTTMIGMALKCLGPIGQLAWDVFNDPDPARLEPHERIAAEFYAAIRDGGLTPVLPDPSSQSRLSQDRQWAVAQASAVDLSILTLGQLHCLYGCFVDASDQWGALTQQPWANEAPVEHFRTPTSAGRIIEREQERAGEIRSRIAEEIRSRKPLTEDEHDWRLETLIRYEILCEGSLRHAPELRAEIAQAWGA